MTQFTSKELLTKSKFKLGLDCPRQIYFYNNKNAYADKNLDNEFLLSLAKGGFQVGALAKAYYPQGIEISSMNPYEAVTMTKEFLERENVVLFEPAFMFENLFVRVDILVKTGNHIELIEVKAKSIEEQWFDNVLEESTWYNYFLDKSYEGVLFKTKMFSEKGCREIQVKSEWQEYIYDVAFQTHVAKLNYPSFNFTSYLCAPDKNKETSIDGLNQKFMVYDVDGKTLVKTIGDISPEALGESPLTTVDLTWLIEAIHRGEDLAFRKFNETVEYFSSICLNNSKPEVAITSICKGCRFNHVADDKKGGFAECVNDVYGIEEKELRSNSTVLDIWSYKPNAVLNYEHDGKKGALFIKDIPEKMNTFPSQIVVPLNQANRQAIQVNKVIKNDETEFFAKKEMKQILKSFKYPLHFIDFETSMVAIPFNKNESPYQTIAFQFSHHILTQEGRVIHAGQYINLDRQNPNVDFIRELKKQLENDEGTIFRWSNHENTVVLFIRRTIDNMTTEQCPDKQELLNFIDEITTKGQFKGIRTMVDMWDIYKKYHYMPETKGSNSIKAVLPAIIGRFDYLKSVLSSPVYGKNLEFTSLNFDEMTWLQETDEGKVKDPYSLLPKIFDEYDREEIDLLFNDDDLKNGGTAMMAYAVCQFKMITQYEKDKIKNALLRYCELDTFAMVMVYLYWYYNCDMDTENQEVSSAG